MFEVLYRESIPPQERDLHQLHLVYDRFCALREVDQREFLYLCELVESDIFRQNYQYYYARGKIKYAYSDFIKKIISHKVERSLPSFNDIFFANVMSE